MFEKVKKVASKLMYAVPVVVFLGFVFYIMAMTYTEEKPGTVQKTIEETRFNFTSYVDLSNKFEELLQKNIFKKYGFINLNGRIARYLGFNSLNERQKLANGYLSGFGGGAIPSESLRNTVELDRFLSSRNIFFLYLLVPSKNSMYDVKFAPGYGDNSRRNIDIMIKGLEKSKVNALNMDAWFQKDLWHTEDVYFKTDHHWKPQAGLAAARHAMELLQQRGVAKYDKSKLSEESYEIKVLKNWFLGSAGKRTGIYYAGIDDISIYLPRFKTGYSYAGLNTSNSNWLYSNTLLDLSHTQEKNYFEDNPYCIYLHKDTGFRIITNTYGVNDKKILVVGDSFKMMIEYFLSTQFQKLYTFDTRYNTDESLVQCIEEIKPNIVLMCSQSGGLIDKRLYEFGIKEYNKALTEAKADEPMLLLGNFVTQAQTGNNNFVTVGNNLETGQTYTLTVGAIELLKGSLPHIQFTLHNQTTNKPVTNHYFIVGKNGEQKWLFTVPHGRDNYGIYLYSGTKGNTADISVKVTDIFLQKGIH